MNRIIGSRAEAFHDKSGQTYTTGGLNCHDLVLGKDGGIHSAKKSGKIPPQLVAFSEARKQIVDKRKNKSSFEDHMVKKGTKAYEDFMKKAKKLQKKESK